MLTPVWVFRIKGGSRAELPEALTFLSVARKGDDRVPHRRGELDGGYAYATHGQRSTHHHDLAATQSRPLLTMFL